MILLIKKLEIEKTKATIVILKGLKVDLTILGIVFVLTNLLMAGISSWKKLLAYLK